MVRGLAHARLGVGAIAGLLTVATLAAGCGGDTTGGTSIAAPHASVTEHVSTPAPDATSSSPSSPSAATSAEADMGAMTVNPSATPASQVPGARESTFILLNTRPPGHNDVRGTAWLAQNATSGTTLTVTATGLVAGGKYVAHLHAKPCAVDNGGGHFKFDPNGPAAPPNEVHLALPADAAGAVQGTVTNARPVGDAAQSVVIHPVDALDKRVACADL
ncbi:superoxide dismutase family protein [Frankia sp. AgPm24]|uniref:superoxide dismutase family protein n=1 Tax=Frankia sp. AgPm24 TaxID=631128 RepID=UPI00200CD361|nr:superoxide dismutase family protein [Frankia sp. AgPm24]MCK9924001.1 superoxide dismutase family protein [Frankia sp. AgPm24]